MAGTYRLYLDTVRSNSGWTTNDEPFSGLPGSAITPDQIAHLNGDNPGADGIATQDDGGVIHFDLDTTRIDLTGSPAGTYTYAGLPSGFVATSKAIWLTATGRSGSTSRVRFDDMGFEEEAWAGGPRTNEEVLADAPVVSMLSTINTGVGLRYDGTGGTVPPPMTCDALRIEGSFIIATWWYSPSLDEWVMGADPGGDYVGSAYPTPRIDTISPNDGPIAGGTAFTITGQGFYGPSGDPEVFGVTFDGFAATSIVVVDAETITGVTPAHWAGGVAVIVALDFEP